MSKWVGIVILLLFLIGCSAQGVETPPDTSWAFPAIHMNGQIYQLTHDNVDRVENLIGEIESYAEDETQEGYKNFSNELPIGTKLYKIPDVDPSEAIAYEKDGEYFKAVASKR